MSAPMAPVGGSTAPAVVDGNPSGAQFSQTDIKVERVVHNWTVRNFSHCYSEYLENFVHLIKGKIKVSDKQKRAVKPQFLPTTTSNCRATNDLFR